MFLIRELHQSKPMLSYANVGAAQAESYYEKDDYYTKGDPDIKSDTQWYGHGATALGLDGPVDTKVFKQLLHGERPDGSSLHSRQIDPEKHRAGTDYTFSAPKSVSIAALIQKDKRVIAAHDNAVQTALQVLESRYAQTRVRRGPGLREQILTGNIVAATFRHETSREQDPQLHTHCVVINATQLENGRWQSLLNDEIVANQKLLGEIYQNELAVQMRQLGYEIELQGNGLFECQGYERPLLDLFSTRSQQIEQYIERWESSLKAKGGKPLHTKQKQKAALATRLRKQSVPREVLLKGWQGVITSGAVQLPAIPTAAPTAVEVTSKKRVRQATRAATDGVNHAAERESVFKREKAERFALEHHLGKQSFSELQEAMQSVGLVPAKNRYTTETAIGRELDTIAIMETGQSQVEAIASVADVEQLTKDEQALTAGQYQAILTTVTSQDQYIAWQGVAGAGKTYGLKLVAQMATEQGYEVTGYAPSAEVANVLSEEAGIESHTVARLLHSQGRCNTEKKAIWIVDEAGLLSAKDAHNLLKKAQAEDARIILVGDTRQLSAVESGNPFKSLQLAGVQTCHLEESRRQKTEALRAAVVCLAAGEPLKGLTRLERTGMIHQLAQSGERRSAIADDYIDLSAEARERTLILSGTNKERLALTAELRKALQGEGSLGADTFVMASLRPRDRTKAQLKYACTYEIGDVIVPVKNYHSYGLKRREQYRVTARDLKDNRLTLAGPQGEIVSFDPTTCVEKTTYEVQVLAIGIGEQLRWTRNGAVEGVRNGQTVTVEAIDSAGTTVLKNAQGSVMTVELTGRQYLDHSLVSTTYSSQGKTAERVLADVDSTLSKESLYVAVSRAKSTLKLYTASKENLYKRAQRSAAKQNPSDYLRLIHLVKKDAENQKTARSAGLLRSLDQSEYAGDRARDFNEHRDRSSSRGNQTTQRATGSAVKRAEFLDETTTSVSQSLPADAAQSHRAATDASRQYEISARRSRRFSKSSIRRLAQTQKYQAIYCRYAAAFPSGSRRSCDEWIAQQAIQHAITSNGGKLSAADMKKIGLMLRQSPFVKRISHAEGEAATYQHVKALLRKELKQLPIHQSSSTSRVERSR